MKWSQLLGTTLRQTGKDTELISHELLLRAAYIRQLSSGIYSLLHFGQRSRMKILHILREEMDRIGGVEICMPLVQPAELWQQTGRYDSIDESLLRFADRNGRQLVLGMTHEEVVAGLVRHEITSYKQLPRLVYQIQTKFRDEARPRGGLVRVKEFEMKDSYSLDKDWEGLEQQYQAHYEAYFRIFERVKLPVMAVLSDTGMMGGRKAHEFMYVSPSGEDTLYMCDRCDYRANKEVARFREEAVGEDPLPLEKVHTPGTKTIAGLAQFLGVAQRQTGKVVFYSLTGEEDVDVMRSLLMVLVRGDMEVNEAKLHNHLRSGNLRAATEAEIRAAGAEPGYASPIGIDRSRCRVLADPSLVHTPNLVVGANEPDYHYLNACYGRDFEADEVVELAAAYEGAACPECEGQLKSVRGIEVGNMFQLGTTYTRALNAFFTDEQGELRPVIMGSYGIGVGRLLACVAEAHHDEHGLCMPLSVAPYQVLLVQLGQSEAVQQAASRIYHHCREAGIEMLWDERPIKSAGIKFKDADLVGIPIRLTISERSLKHGGVELKLRSRQEREMVAEEKLPERLYDLMAGMR